MRFLADLHIHSKFSRATSRDCDLEHLALFGLRKGLTLIATGDFTHPLWFEEMREKLVPAEDGLFRLREDLDRAVRAQVPASCASAPLRFILSVEISTIYKRDEKTRKVHHVLYAPNFEQAGALRRALGRIGNLASDGRPILGLDSRDLLEMALESGPGLFLIPAHIWTPWFSALGSKSGFDSIADCYADLASHIFAVETGLSSDPAMNWRVPSLDRYRLVSNSDAHSPAMLGREANRFDCELDYASVRQALATGEGFGGTLEFFPEEGKYHLDGHRNCGLCLTPDETRSHGGRCPSCGGLITVGVQSRVEDLATRPEGFRLPGAANFESLIPLPEIVAELERVGTQSQRVRRSIEQITDRLGPELLILRDLPIEEIRQKGSTLLAEAITRLRTGKVHRQAGYDGEFGVIRLFEPHELDGRGKSPLLFALPEAPKPRPATPTPEPRISCQTVANTTETTCGDGPFSPPDASEDRVADVASAPEPVSPFLEALDPDQRRAAAIASGPLLILAGPGTGKTRTLTHRLAHLVAIEGVDPARCLAITFTRKAAGELRERLGSLLPGQADRLHVTTFHGFGLDFLREESALIGLPREFTVIEEEGEGGRRALIADLFQVTPSEAEKLSESIRREPDSDMARRLRAALIDRGQVDFDALIDLPVQLLEANPALTAKWRERFEHICIDEYQDIDARQYRLVQFLAPGSANLCAIGDPDQAIYGFRGASVTFFMQFTQDHPGAQQVTLTRNYRSSPAIVTAALDAIAPQTLAPNRELIATRAEGIAQISLFEAQNARAEAEWIAQSIEARVGGISHRSFDERPALGHAESRELGFSDFAILYRTDAQASAIMEALARRSLPFQKSGHDRLTARRGVREVRNGLRQLNASLEDTPIDQPVRDLLVKVVRGLLDKADDDRSVELSSALDLLTPIAARSQKLAEFLSALDEGLEIDALDPRAERIWLLTLHASKGLEFPVVFLAGCDDGLLPLNPRFEPLDMDALAEERRLFFVGMTRARDELILTHTRQRTLWGVERTLAPSPFVAPIRATLIERQQSEFLPRKRRPKQLKLF
ncbi:MAG: UvrD-helicase domain-containing protein [Myxococcales bacterium]|jgi:uncharacterized protein (TIGR00375 family)|nr:UvrD-helicase domain-containing protein [Myxococcales bacterium]